jgi:hypothetical protein
MYANVPPGFALVRENYLTPGGTAHAETVYGVKVEGVFDNASSVALAAQSAWQTIMQAMSEDYQLTGTQVIWNNGGVLEEGNATGGTNGAVGSHALPSNVAAVIRKQTTQVGKHGRGHFSIPGIADGQQNSSTDNFTIPALALWQAKITQVFTDLTDATIPLYLLHKSALVPPTLVIGVTVQSLFGSQRRRLRKAPHR